MPLNNQQQQSLSQLSFSNLPDIPDIVYPKSILFIPAYLIWHHRGHVLIISHASLDLLHGELQESYIWC